MTVGPLYCTKFFVPPRCLSASSLLYSISSLGSLSFTTSLLYDLSNYDSPAPIQHEIHVCSTALPDYFLQLISLSIPVYVLDMRCRGLAINTGSRQGKTSQNTLAHSSVNPCRFSWYAKEFSLFSLTWDLRSAQAASCPAGQSR